MYKTISIINYVIWKRDAALDRARRRHVGVVALGDGSGFAEIRPIQPAGRRFRGVRGGCRALNSRRGGVQRGQNSSGKIGFRGVKAQVSP